MPTMNIRKLGIEGVAGAKWDGSRDLSDWLTSVTGYPTDRYDVPQRGDFVMVICNVRGNNSAKSAKFVEGRNSIAISEWNEILEDGFWIFQVTDWTIRAVYKGSLYE